MVKSTDISVAGAFRNVSRCAINGKITASSDTVAMATHRRAVGTSTSRAFGRVTRESQFAEQQKRETLLASFGKLILQNQALQTGF